MVLSGFETSHPVIDFGRQLGSRTAAAIALVIAAVPITFGCLLAWTALGRPVFFTQVRSGLNRKPFRIFKIRTMREHRDPTGALLPDALRETDATRALRRSRVDELPQLLAVLWGDMAIIGPRPLLPQTIEDMGELGRVRCTVRPGLTGWAQVNGNTRLSNDQKLALDIWYIDHHSFSLDLQILLLTITTLLCGERINHSNLDMAQAHLSGRNRATMVSG
jgi:lipopolysaccharide/colanic/teichoic acid biosynthesis glycosyltransferase